MGNSILPKQLPNTADNIYAGFWTRLAALLLDFVIVLPLSASIVYVNGLSRSAYFMMIVPNLLLFFILHLYLVKKYGGTPGKLIMGIKIIRNEGSDVGYKEAFMRLLVMLVITIFSTIVMFLAVSQLDDAYYQSLTFLTRNKVLSEINPLAFKVNEWGSTFWYVVSLIVLLSNKRYRAIHDFIAGTVVIKKIYSEKIMEYKNADSVKE